MAATFHRRVTGAAVALVALTALGVAAPAAAYPEPPARISPDGACEGQFLALHNAERTSRRLPALREDRSFDQVARAWATNLAQTQRLAHNPSYSTQIRSAVPGTVTSGENVGSGPSAAQLHTAFMNSSGHRANILSTSYSRIAVACVRDAAGKVWVTVNFLGHPTAIPDRRPVPFASAGSASGQLRYWMLSAGPDASKIESDAARILDGTNDAAGFASWLAASSAHSTTVPAVTRLYYAAFLRHPDVDGLTHWIRTRHGGTDLVTIAGRFVASAEFQARYGSLSNADYVDLVYRNVLGRSPDATGLAFWVQRMRDGWSRGRVLVGFSESAEYVADTRGDVLVSWAWIQLLGRVATPTERAEWTASIARGTTVTQVVTFLVRSGAMATRAATHSYA